MKFQFYDIVSVAAIISYFIPLLLVIAKKLWSEPFFLLFAIYWSIGGVVNGCDIIPLFSKTACYYVGVVYNIFDIPIILSILYYTSTSRSIRNLIPYATAAILLMEVVGLLRWGFIFDALKYSLGAGIAVVLFIIVKEIATYMQQVEHTNRQNARMFVYAAVLFDYATFIVIYIFDYFVDHSVIEDSLLIYYFSTLVAIFIASCGYLVYRKYDEGLKVRGRTML